MTTTRTAIFVPSTRSLVKVTAHGVSSESCRDKAAHCADRRKLWSQHLDSVKCLHRLTGPARMFAIAKYSRMVRSRRWLSANNRVDVSIPGRNRSLIPLLSFDELPSASSIHAFTLDFHLWWVVFVDFSFLEIAIAMQLSASRMTLKKIRLRGWVDSSNVSWTFNVCYAVCRIIRGPSLIKKSQVSQVWSFTRERFIAELSARSQISSSRDVLLA